MAMARTVCFIPIAIIDQELITMKEAVVIAIKCHTYSAMKKTVVAVAINNYIAIKQTVITISTIIISI